MHLADTEYGYNILGDGGLGAYALSDGWDTALDIFSKVGTAAGGFLQSRQADSALAQKGESAFTAMKAAAEASGWPPNLSPAVVTLDKQWQQMKTKALVPAEVDAITLQMQAVTQQLLGSVGGGRPVPGAGDVAAALAKMKEQAKKKSSRTLLYVAGALAVAGAGYYFVLRPRGTGAPAVAPAAVAGYFGAYRPRRRHTRRRASLGCGCGA